MFSALENELIRILRDNLSAPGVEPALVDGADIVNGPRTPPNASELPVVVVTAHTYAPASSDAHEPPRGVNALVEESFAPNGAGPLQLRERPLAPLRAVEVEATPGGERILLRERDDYTVDYVNGNLRLRQPPAGDTFVQFFMRQPLDILSASRLRVDITVDIFADDDPAVTANQTRVGAIALGALSANATAVDGLLAPAQEVVNSGLPALGTRHVFFIFEALTPTGGDRPAADYWRLHFQATATLVLTPAAGGVGRMRHIATTLAWDEELAARVLQTPPPLLDRPVTILQGVGAATANALAALGVVTVGGLAALQPPGQAALDTAVGRARDVRTAARGALSTIVTAGPTIDDVPAFLALNLATVTADDLIGVDLAAEAATAVLDHLATLDDNVSINDLIMADIFLV